MEKGIKIKSEKSNTKWTLLPEINFAWKKGYYFFVFFNWLKWSCTVSYNFVSI